MSGRLKPGPHPVPTVVLTAHPPTIADVVAVARDGAAVEFSPAVGMVIAFSRTVVDAHLGAESGVYGLNRELGAGRDIAVAVEMTAAFQRRIIRNHNAALGEPLSTEQVRAIILGRLIGFTRGGSGVRPELATLYLELLNRDVRPVVRRTGSVGAADLVQLAAIAAVVIGEGEAYLDGVIVDGTTALRAAGLEPLALAAHEGLASLSSNAYSSGIGALVVSDTALIAPAADRAVALSLHALSLHGTGGNASPFDPLLADARKSPAQARSASRILAALAGTPVVDASRPASTQDHVSFRSAPQLHGALDTAVATALAAITTELSAKTDNPLVDIPSMRMISGGNFQAIDLALSFEALRLVLASVAGASERRLAALSRLQAPFRRDGSARVPGLLWYSASAQLAELRHLANPITLLGTSLSDDVEDHSAHGPLALQLLERSLELTRSILAVEALTAADLIQVGGGESALANELLPGGEPDHTQAHAQAEAPVSANARVTAAIQVLLRST